MNFKEKNTDKIYVMSSSRIVRGTKARVFLYVCLVLIIVGIIACYKNTLSQLERVKISNDICHKQEEHLTTQLRVISEYKQSLEKSLQIEKAVRGQKENELEKLKEDTSNHEKLMNESKMRYSSLKQQYNLLKTQHDDFQEECSKVKKEHLTQINDIQAKVGELQEEVKKERNAKENLKSQYLQIETEVVSLRQQLKGNSDVRANDEDKINHLTKLNHELTRQLEAMKEKCYADHISEQVEHNVMAPSNDTNKVQSSSSGYQKNNVKSPNTNVGEEPPAQPPAQERRVLAQPSNGKIGSSSTTSSSLKLSRASLNGARPLLLPTVTPSTSSKKSVGDDSFQNLVLPMPYRKVPEGVVPVPMGPVADDMPNDIISNRYSNKINNDINKESKPKVEEGDKENGANEEFDGALEGDAMDGMGFGDEKKDPIKDAEKHNFKKQHIDALAAMNHKERNKEYDSPQERKDYKDAVNDNQLEENEPEEDDDGDDYGDQHQKDPIVRN